MTEQPDFVLLGDQPHVAEDDPLGFDAVAEQLCGLVLGSRPSTPFTLGIEAGWGMGKSSLMRRLEAKLAERRDVKTVWFNSWTAEDGTALEGLIKSVLDAIDPRILRRALRNQNLMGLARAGTSMVAGRFGLSALTDQVWERLSADAKARNDMRRLMQDAMTQWRDPSGRGREDRLLVVFIDDLDRCSPENVFGVFEAIKLYLDAPALVFVIGYDKEIVSDAVLTSKQYSKAVRSRDYLEKVVQIGFRIPQAGEERTRALIASFLRDSRTETLFDESARRLVIDRNARNPRRMKRFVNGFILAYGLDPEWGELGAEALIRVLILYEYFPDFARRLDDASDEDPIQEFLDYTWVRDFLRAEPDRADGAAEWARADAVLVDNKVKPGSKPAAELLKALEQEVDESFPALVQDEAFRSVVEGLGAPNQRAALLEKLGRGRPASVSTGATGAAEAYEPPPLPSGELAGTRLLWVDDLPENNEALIAALEGAGAAVLVARETEEAVRHLADGSVNALISDIGRSGRPDAGFEDLEEWRNSGLFSGPAIFFTSRVTPARRQRAAGLEAAVTASPRELVAFLERSSGVGALHKRVRKEVPLPLVRVAYRPGDAAEHAARLHRALMDALGTGRVSLQEHAGPGSPYAVPQPHDVFIEVIGPRWAAAGEIDGSLDTALASGTTVQPVLVAGAPMPPGPLERLEPIELREDNWDWAVGRLKELAEGVLGPEPQPA